LTGRAEEILRRREVLGWRLGLERMRRLCSLLGMPQNRFSSIHVVGTNGKTSVTLMTAGLLQAHGVSTGAYISPHISDWRERIRIRGEPISREAFDEAVERAEESAQAADRAAGDEGPVTQFELLTAAAFVAFAEARVPHAVVEAGLGGRLDATNVIPSRLTVLTSVGLDHTEYLGDTLEEIATEKLAVLRDHTKLIVGPLPDEVTPVVEGAAKRHHVELHRVAAEGPFGFLTQNLALAEAAVQELLGGADLDPRVVSQLQGSIPGRAQVIQADPPVVLDAAHNPDGAKALAEILPKIGPDRWVRRGLRKRPMPREVVCCLAVLDDKDAAGIVSALAPAVSRFICTEVAPEQIEGSGRPGGKSLPAERLAEIARRQGVEADAISGPNQAWTRARELAKERGAVALAAGSHYLLASIWTERPDRSF
jgi:dihydrofolate synthase/folylpolyglutamate synthase